MKISRDQNRKLWNPEIETLSRDVLETLQLERLKKQLVYNFENSEFYRGQFGKAGAEPADIRSFDDFSRLPLMDKISDANLTPQPTHAMKSWTDAPVRPTNKL